MLRGRARTKLGLALMASVAANVALTAWIVRGAVGAAPSSDAARWHAIGCETLARDLQRTAAGESSLGLARLDTAAQRNAVAGLLQAQFSVCLHGSVAGEAAAGLEHRFVRALAGYREARDGSDVGDYLAVMRDAMTEVNGARGR